MPRTRQEAFTLVELSIVLVIIGLLVGGILVGQNLIAGGQVSKQVSQISQYRTSTNSFRDKYNGLPGDLIAQTANGFVMTARTGAAGHGDGNGRIEGCSTNAMLAGCEALLYWNDLTFAGLLSPSMNTATDALTAMSGAARASYLPPGSINGNYVVPFTDGAMNYYQLAGVDSTTAGGVYTLSNQLTPMQSMSIDQKLDDGMPLIGAVRAVGGTGPLNVAAVPGAANCVATSTDNPYNTVTSALGDGVLCQLRFNMN